MQPCECLDTLPYSGTFSGMNRVSDKTSLKRKPSKGNSGRSGEGQRLRTDPKLTESSPIDRAPGPPAVVSLSGVQNAAPSLITRELEPENLEFPFSTLNSALTPNEQFFVRSHFPVPKLDLLSWKLQVEGQVERCLEFGYDELTRMPARTVTMVMECAGNSRIFLSPKVGGLQWELGAVGNAEWTGVPLAAVLQAAGVKAGAVEVVLEGADHGEIRKEPVSPGKITYARGLPLAKALSPDVILAYRMNGEPLTPAHGYPLRAVVSGWYGMASVKWLTRIVVIDRAFRGYFQTADYTFWERRDGLPIQLLPVGEVEVKAEIARPALHEVVPAEAEYRIHGAAWTGESEVTKVEVSTDGARNWCATRLLGESTRYGWRLWEYYWHTPAQPGHYTLMARATDARGRTQPIERDAHRGTYVITHIQPIEVEVRKLPPGAVESYAI
ncbi:MAG TPA: sulfite oxidase [Candidatus Binataceae bacterium]|nr:sulfite oxidase [Candidatus Binataceae bacterium]